MQRLCKVKTKEQIKQTLDKNGICSGVAMSSKMYRHCGEVYIARPRDDGRKWRLYDKKNRPICSEFGWAWTWVTEWLDFGAADENDLTKIIEGGCEK